MSGQRGISGPRRKYERAPSEENLGETVDVTDENKNRTTNSNTDVEFGDGVDLDFSIVKAREVSQERSKMHRITMAIITIFVVFLMIVVKPNYNFSKTPTLHPPNHNLNEMCSKEAVQTSDGLTSCKTICDPAFCCFTSSPSNCMIENRKACHEYSACKPFFSEEDYSKEEPYFFETGKVDKNGNIGYVEGGIDGVDGEGMEISPGFTIVKPAPLNIDDICSKENRITPSGMLQCEAACEGGACCWEGTCNERYQKECKNYEVCKSAGSSLVSPVEQINYVCSPTKIGSLSKTLSALERDKNIDECRSLCESRSCCFSKGPDNCYNDNSRWCDEFASCKGLANTDADSPPPIPTGTVDIKNDCRTELVLSSNDYVKCEQACLVASCCFSVEGCAKKGVVCEDFSVCRPFIESVETGGGSFGDTTGTLYIDTDDSPPEDGGSSFPHVDEKLEKSKIKSGEVESGATETLEMDDYFTKYENMQTEKASEHNSVDDLFQSEGSTKVKGNDDAYYRNEGTIQDIENSISNQVVENPANDDTFAMNGQGVQEESNSLTKTNNDDDDDEYFTYEGITQDIEKTIGQKVVEKVNDDDYFNLKEKTDDEIRDEAQEKEKNSPTDNEDDDRYFNIEGITEDIENGQKVQVNDDYFNIEEGSLETKESGNEEINDEDILQELLKIEKEVELFNEANEESANQEEIIEERPNLTSLMPALNNVCDAESIDDPEVASACKESCSPALCCVGQGDIDCSVSDPNLCRAFAACNPFWEMEGYRPIFIEETKESSISGSVKVVEEVVTNKFGDPVETVDVPMTSAATSSSKLTAIDEVCARDKVESPTGYKECAVLCTPALCCIGIGIDCSTSKQDWCADHAACSNVWIGSSETNKETNNDNNEAFVKETHSPTIRTTSFPTAAPTYRTTPLPTYQPIDLIKSIPAHSNGPAEEDEPISKVCSEESISNQGGLNRCVLRCNSALCCIGAGTDCYMEKREWCDEYSHTCQKIFSEELNSNFGTLSQNSEERIQITPSPTQAPTTSPTPLPLKRPDVPINIVCSKENVSTQGGHDHCVLECNAAHCCFGIGNDCSVTKSEWCEDYKACSNVWVN